MAYDTSWFGGEAKKFYLQSDRFMPTLKISQKKLFSSYYGHIGGLKYERLD